MIKISKACKKFGSTIVINDLDLYIESKGIFGIVGPSGSGKSTLLRAIQGLESLDSGHIQLTHSSGFMFQDFQLFPHLSVLDNLCYAPLIQLKSNNFSAKYQNKNFIIEKALILLEKLGIIDNKFYFPSQLSGGQKQRVALARTLMMEPKIILFDEPTSGLDNKSIDSVISLLKSINNLEIIMVIASHNLEFLRNICNKIFYIENGKINPL